MEKIRNEMSRVEVELEICEAELAEMIQKRERAKEEIKKKKSKIEKVRVHKLIIFASAFFSCMPKDDIFHYDDAALQNIGKNIGKNIYKACSAHSSKLPKPET